MCNSKTTAFFFDIDYTIYDPVHDCIPSKTKEALALLKQDGYKIALASSRPFKGIQATRELFDIPWDGFVAANGLQVLNSQMDIIYENGLSKRQLYTVFHTAEKHNVPVYAVGNTAFFTQMDPMVEAFIQDFHVPCQVVKKYDGEDILLITLIHDRYDQIRQWFDFPGTELIHSGRYNTDVFKVGINKYTGIQQLMKDWQVPIQCTVSFGDSNSDIPMLKNTSIGVAMGNAADPIKDIANDVCGWYDADGIYDYLKKYGYIL